MEAIIGQSKETQGVWFRTHISVEGNKVRATTFSTSKGHPNLFSFDLDLMPIIRFVERASSTVGCDTIGAKKRKVKRLVKAKVFQKVSKHLNTQIRSVRAPMVSAASKALFPVSSGAVAAYRAAKHLLEKSEGRVAGSDTVGVLPLIPVAMAVASSPVIKNALKKGAKKLAKYGKKVFSKAFGKLASKARRKGLLKKHGRKALKAVKALASKVAEKRIQKVLQKAPALRAVLQNPKVHQAVSKMVESNNDIAAIWAKTKLAGAEGVKARKAAAILRLVAEHDNHQEQLKKYIGNTVVSGAVPVVGCVGCSYYSV